jgi:hypothetical protein
MAESLHQFLERSGVLQHVILSPALQAMLGALVSDDLPAALPAGGIVSGRVLLDDNLSQSPLPGLDLALALPTELVEPAPFKLQLTPAAAPTSFLCWIVLREQGQARLGFKFIEQVPGARPMLVSRSDQPGAALGPALLVEGPAGGLARVRFTPDTDPTPGIVAFGLEPPTVMFGGSGVGFRCPAIVIDDSEQHAAPGAGAPALDPPLAALPADAPAWRGLLARELTFYLPAARAARSWCWNRLYRRRRPRGRSRRAPATACASNAWIPRPAAWQACCPRW